MHIFNFKNLIVNTSLNDEVGAGILAIKLKITVHI
jgi:hypothetical protein